MNAEMVNKKLNVLAVLEKTKNMQATILRFYPKISEVAYKSKRTHIYSWEKAHQKLRAATQANKGGHRKIRDKEGVSTAMLTIQAKKVAAEAAVSPFSASGCWVNGFKARHRMSVRASTRQGKQGPADLDNIAIGFAAHVEEIVRHLGINRIYNADQTGISSNGQRIV
uniref:Uncharacterized protein AlNc14C91G5685 n=1 Tax=Albugo laibachii Nc14 TaxID=890382 RepID=F0WGF3_9STRA|nr:conserved hypothetical protein [Albugo laibachii Nc14]|eukprot:CCA20314.1 conserved hypothetical protein [Albugo laibachii Nc14]